MDELKRLALAMRKRGRLRVWSLERLGERPEIEEAVEELEKRARGWLESDEARQRMQRQRPPENSALCGSVRSPRSSRSGCRPFRSPHIDGPLSLLFVSRRTFAPVSKRVPAAVVAVEGAFATNAMLIMPSMVLDSDSVQRYTAVSSGVRPAKAKASGPAVRNGFSALA